MECNEEENLMKTLLLATALCLLPLAAHAQFFNPSAVGGGSASRAPSTGQCWGIAQPAQCRQQPVIRSKQVRKTAKSNRR
jgi:hypothetical protein